MKNAQIMIIRTNLKNDPDSATLKECGFKVGDIVEVEGFFRDGEACVYAIRDGECGVKAGDNISVSRDEYVVVEGVV